MSNTLGDQLYDLITDAISDVVSTANRKEEELEAKIYELENEIETLKEQE